MNISMTIMLQYSLYSIQESKVSNVLVKLIVDSLCLCICVCVCLVIALTYPCNILRADESFFCNLKRCHGSIYTHFSVNDESAHNIIFMTSSLSHSEVQRINSLMLNSIWGLSYMLSSLPYNMDFSGVAPLYQNIIHV